MIPLVPMGWANAFVQAENAHLRWAAVEISRLRETSKLLAPGDTGSRSLKFYVALVLETESAENIIKSVMTWKIRVLLIIPKQAVLTTKTVTI
jgi:hypothetical protein